MFNKIQIEKKTIKIKQKGFLSSVFVSFPSTDFNIEPS